MLTARFGKPQRVAVKSPADTPSTMKAPQNRGAALPEWNSSVTDLDSYKLSVSEQVSTLACPFVQPAVPTIIRPLYKR